jgi:hypothetical protein
MRRCKLCRRAEDIEGIELVGAYCLQCDKIVGDIYADLATRS